MAQALMVVTRLRLSSPTYRDAFFSQAVAIAVQVESAPGCIASEVLPDAGDVYWTWTSWEDTASMRAFMRSEPHRSAMRRIGEWCDEATYVEWEQEASLERDWSAAHARLVADGVVTRLPDPSPAHAERCFAPPTTP